MAERSKLLSYGLPLLAVVAAGYATASIVRTQPAKIEVQPALQPPVQPVTPQAAVNGAGYIGSAGLVEPPGEQVAIGAPVSGLVTRVAVVAGQTVKAGDILFEIDRRTAEAQLALRRTELQVAEKKLAQTEARIPSLTAAVTAAKATVEANRADLEDLKDQLASSQQLKARDSAALSERELTRRRNAERAAAARLKESEARVAQAEAELELVAGGPNGQPSLDVERANVAQAKSAVDRAAADLDQLTVRAPSDATVLQVNIRAGEFAQAAVVATPLMVIGPLTPLNVRVDIDEADIGRFSPAAKALASLRGQADRRAALAFVRVEPLVVPKRALTGVGSERVDTRVLRVVYELPPGSLDAYPGQQVDVFIEANATPEAARLTLNGGSKPAPR